MAKKNLKELVRQNEFWVGVVTVGAIVLIVGGAILGDRVSITKQDNSVETPNEATQEAQLEDQNAEVHAITELADTSGYYTVETGDNYYQISEKVCGTGVYFESIAAANGNKALHAGTKLTVDCK